jgi:carbonic anhydrase/acetyltransferase-like protein (isoleucine patch superfamily)
MVIDRIRRVGEVWIAENAAITGDVVLGPDVSVWFAASIRGDDAPVTIGAKTNIQDHVMVHADPGIPNEIGESIVVGHRAILHGARIGDRCLIGMGSILLTGSVVGEECIIAAGAVVTEHREIPPRSVVMGVPGRVVRSVTDEEVEEILWSVDHYVERAREHEEGNFR